ARLRAPRPSSNVALRRRIIRCNLARELADERAKNATLTERCHAFEIEVKHLRLLADAAAAQPVKPSDADDIGARRLVRKRGTVWGRDVPTSTCLAAADATATTLSGPSAEASTTTSVGTRNKLDKSATLAERCHALEEKLAAAHAATEEAQCSTCTRACTDTYTSTSTTTDPAPVTSSAQAHAAYVRAILAVADADGHIEAVDAQVALDSARAALESRPRQPVPATSGKTCTDNTVSSSRSSTTIAEDCP
ncbi:hypothetical protein H4R19_005621, partial [Coemansia spiralis]